MIEKGRRRRRKGIEGAGEREEWNIRRGREKERARRVGGGGRGGASVTVTH